MGGRNISIITSDFFTQRSLYSENKSSAFPDPTHIIRRILFYPPIQDFNAASYDNDLSLQPFPNLDVKKRHATSSSNCPQITRSLEWLLHRRLFRRQKRCLS